MKKILVIDDEFELCELLKDFLTDKGYKVIYAVTGQGGLDAFASENPPLVLLDFCLKKTSGLTILKKIKELAPETKVIIMTSSAREKDRQKIIQAGADHYLHKPFSLIDLGVIIKELLE